MKPPKGVIAGITGGMDITRPWLHALSTVPIFDPILAGQGGGNFEIYDEVLRDDQVAATFQQRRMAVTAAPWSVTPGGEDRASRKAAEHLQANLERLSWDAITDQMLFGVFYGFAVGECIWDVSGRLVELEEIAVRDQRRFVFNASGQLRLRTMSAYVDGVELEERKFWRFATGSPHGDNPYGIGLAHWLYWPTIFKRGGMRGWLILLEKFGMPTAKGMFPSSATDEDKAKLLDAVGMIQSDAGIIIPDNMTIELVEATRGGSPGYEAFLDRMNGAIAKVVLSQALTTEAAGGQYKADVQKAVRNEVVKADSDLICDSFNRTVARWMTEWNFPGAIPPRVIRQTDESEDLTERSKREVHLHQIGYRLNKDAVREIYGDGYEPVDPPTPPTPGKEKKPDKSEKDESDPVFAEPEEDAPNPVAIVDALTGQAVREAAPIVEGWVEQLRAAVMESADYEELISKVEVMFPALDHQTLGTMLGEAMLTAELAGRDEVNRVG